MSFLSAAERVPTVGLPASSASWRFTVTAEAPCFAGHFDGDPVLPGVAHIAVALEACAQLQPDMPALAAVEDLRFTQPVLPGVLCDVTVSARSETSVHFDIRCQDAPSSRGVLVFAGPWMPAP